MISFYCCLRAFILGHSIYKVADNFYKYLKFRFWACFKNKCFSISFFFFYRWSRQRWTRTRVSYMRVFLSVSLSIHLSFSSFSSPVFRRLILTKFSHFIPWNLCTFPTVLSARCAFSDSSSLLELTHFNHVVSWRPDKSPDRRWHLHQHRTWNVLKKSSYW